MELLKCLEIYGWFHGVYTSFWKWSSILILILHFIGRHTGKHVGKKITNLSHKFRGPTTKTRYMYEVSKVSSRCGYFFRTVALSICVGCRIKFCIQWSKFQSDHLRNICGCGPKYWFWPCSASMSRRNLFLDLCSPYNWLHWMQNLILHRMVRISKGSPWKNTGIFRPEYCVCSPVLLHSKKKRVFVTIWNPFRVSEWLGNLFWGFRALQKP
jgi:hypothetical protein